MTDGVGVLLCTYSKSSIAVKMWWIIDEEVFICCPPRTHCGKGCLTQPFLSIKTETAFKTKKKTCFSHTHIGLSLQNNSNCRKGLTQAIFHQTSLKLGV